MTTYATRSQILAAGALRERDYTTADGAVVRIRELNAEQRLEASDAQEAIKEARGGRYTVLSAATFNAYVVVAGLIDEPGGRPVFQESDIPDLVSRRADWLASLADVIWHFSDADRGGLRAGHPTTDGGQLDAAGGAADADGTADG